MNDTYVSDGYSLIHTLTDKGNQGNHEFLYWEFPSYKGQQAIRMGKWKGIRRDIYEGNMTLELYDLENDVLEENDVSEAHPEIVKTIEKLMEGQHETSVIERFQFVELGDN